MRPATTRSLPGARGVGLALLVLLAALSCAGRPARLPELRLTSPAFRDGAPIPVRHTCDGADLSPALAWGGVPEATRSLALVCDDPDAPGGTWVHWVLFDLAPTARSLPQGVPVGAVLGDSSRQGINDFGKAGYGGPCPPPGKPHRYFFKIYALDAVPALEGAVTKQGLEAAMKGHLLATGRLVGTYRR